MAKRNHTIDMCSGPIFSKMLVYAIPLMLSSVLQLLFNAADMVVAGRFVGSEALAAVGATAPLINLLVGVFTGLSIGTDVLVARFIGARDAKMTSDSVHTSIAASLLFGMFLLVAGLIAAKPLLVMMGTPDDVMDASLAYTRIYFLGMPAMMVYNFGAAVLRAMGDTKRSMYYLVIAGVLNVILNVFFIVALHTGVVGVALATVISQMVSAALVIICLLRSDGPCQLHLKHLRINWRMLGDIAKIGLPAGIESAIYSISNVIIQSSINSFGSLAMAGNTAAGNIESCVSVAGAAFFSAGLSFTSQNIGAKQFARVDRIVFYTTILSTAMRLLLGALAMVFGSPLLSIYVSDPVAIEHGLIRMSMCTLLNFICGLMNGCTAYLRGMGYSLLPTLVTVISVCGLRIVWLFTAFPANPTPLMLYVCYPMTWSAAALGLLICFIVIRRKNPVNRQA